MNAAETEAAKEKLQKIKTAFERWVWTDPDRADRLSRLYNDQFNNLVPRHFDGSHLQLPGASNVITLRAHQRRVIWRIISAGQTYIAHAVGAGKTFSMAAEYNGAEATRPHQQSHDGGSRPLPRASQPRILAPLPKRPESSLRTKPISPRTSATVFCPAPPPPPGTASLSRTRAFQFIPAPAEFEKLLIQRQINGYSELLEKVDGDDRISRKRIESMKEKLEAKFEALQSRKDDLLTIGEIGIDQIIVDEAQIFRKLSFPSNMTSLKGVDPDGSQRAWDLFVKSRYTAEKNPGRALILASGTPITNTLGEMFTLQRFMQMEALEERGIHEFDAWAATFGETRTELELQPSGLYKPVTRFSEFVNVADLMAMYRSVADVVLKSDLRNYLRLPTILGGKRQIVTADPTPAFKAYQRVLAERIAKIEERKGKPQKGDDILLSVITDGRHASHRHAIRPP